MRYSLRCLSSMEYCCCLLWLVAITSWHQLGVRGAKSLSELNREELQLLANPNRHEKLQVSDEHGDGCGTHVPTQTVRSGASSLRGRRSSSTFDTLGCGHCPTDGLCDNPEIRNLYKNKSEQLNVNVTWHLLPDGNGNYDVSLKDLEAALDKLTQSYAVLGLNFSSKYMLYSTSDSPSCSEEKAAPANFSFSDLRLARVATSQHPSSPHPYCFTQTAPHTLGHIYFHRVTVRSNSYAILSYADQDVSVAYGAHQRTGDILFYSIASSDSDFTEMVLYRFPERQTLRTEKFPSTAISNVSLSLGINLEFTIPEDGDYFIWVYNRRTDNESILVQFIVSFIKSNCFSRDQFVSCFETHLEPNSLNVIIAPSDLFQTLYQLTGDHLVASSVEGFAYFPFEVTFPWQVGLSVVAVEAILNPSWSVLQHEIGHNFGLWHPSHGITETTQCQTQTDNAPCTGDQFRCLTVEKCIPVNWYCDGWLDCDDDSDEPPPCQSLCYGKCQNPCRESNSYSDYVRDRVGDFCKDTPATYTHGEPLCDNLVVTSSARSSNLMATRRATITHLSLEQKARARCWLLNAAHQSFVSCRKEIQIQYNDYIDECVSTPTQTELVNGSIFVECTADPCEYVNPCQNNGICVSRYDTVSCDCTTTGYCGEFCTMPVNSTSYCQVQQTTTPPTTSQTATTASQIAPTSTKIYVTTPTSGEPTSSEAITTTTTTTDKSPSCSETTYGCCHDGVTAAGPYQSGCPGVEVGDVWGSSFSDYLSSFETWKKGCS